ncbi:MAG: hypothetical protein ACJARD_001299 [Alphaproteobacteria bacterium]|jgi:hypothetical protein
MRRNRLRTRLNKQKPLKRITDTDNFKKNNAEICDQIMQPDNQELDYHNMMNLINDDIFNLIHHDIEPVKELDRVPYALKNLINIIEHSGYKDMTQEKVKEIDPDLDFRFLSRKPFDNIHMPSIKTRLKWQKGEFPFFKIEVRHHRQEAIYYQNKRSIERFIKCFSLQDATLDKYIPMPLPDDAWPCKGQLYVSNHRLFYKRAKKENSIFIVFHNILSYHFYENAFSVVHFKHNQKITDVFYVDAGQARLLETIIRITV